jgi:hypothetical protein
MKLQSEAQRMKTTELEAKRKARSAFATNLNQHLELNHQLKAKELAEEKDLARRSVGLNLGRPRGDYRELVKRELDHQLD